MISREEALQNIIDEGSPVFDRALMYYVTGRLTSEQYLNCIENIIDSEIVAFSQRLRDPENRDADDYEGWSA